MHDSWAHGTDHPEMHTIARSILEPRQKKKENKRKELKIFSISNQLQAFSTQPICTPVDPSIGSCHSSIVLLEQLPVYDIQSFIQNQATCSMR